MGYCYFCNDAWVGYVSGGYFCDECERLRKVCIALTPRKINENIKFKMEIFNENEKELKTYNTRSKKN